MAKQVAMVGKTTSLVNGLYPKTLETNLALSPVIIAHQ
jgi:hypothetical protein